MTSPIAVFAIPAVLLALLLRFIIQYFRSPLRTVPGPTLARFTDGWYFWKVWEGSFQDVNLDLHKKYGRFTRQYLIYNFY
jgi:hypothetical protein